MIRKLQFRVVALSMSAFFVVLTVIIVSINVSNFHTVVKEADTLLTILAENEAHFPPEMNNKEEYPHDWMSPETPYKARYFYVLLRLTDGSIIQSDTSKIVSISSTEAVNYAEKVVSKGENKGFLQTYRFIRYPEGETCRVIFLDCHDELESFRDFLCTSIWISLAGYLVVFCVI